jgi:hypothetical protein
MKTLESRLDDAYTIDGRVLLSITLELKKGSLDGDYPREYVKILAMYNERGILRTYKLYITNHVVIIDISYDKNPGPGLAIIIFFGVLTLLGIGFFMIKRIKKRK